MNDLKLSMEDHLRASRQIHGTAIIPPIIKTSFIIEKQILDLIKEECHFNGTIEEDAYQHLRNFTSMCTLFKYNQIEDEHIYLILFPWTLKGEAKDWFNQLAERKIAIWDQMVEKILKRFFPPSKMIRLQNEINQFKQEPQETLYDVWTRYEKLIKSCPQHRLNDVQRLIQFYKNITIATRKEIDTADGGAALSKTPEDLQQLISDLAIQSYDWYQLNTNPQESKTEVKNEMISLQKKDRGSGKRIQRIKGKTYDRGLYFVPLRLNINVFQLSQEETLSKGLADIMRGYIYNQTELNNIILYKISELYHNHQNLILNLEKDLGTLSKQLAVRETGTLPSNTLENPRGNLEVQAITTRSGKTTKDPVTLSQEEPLNEASTTKSNDETPLKTDVPFKIDKPLEPVPYPQQLRKAKQQKRIENFANMFNNINVNIPLIDLLRENPHYGKYLKTLLSNKGKDAENSSRFIIKECKAIFQKLDVPEKLGNAGSITVPCSFNDSRVYQALADTGASINLMPYSLYKRLGLGELTPTRMSICLADSSFNYPMGIAENIQTKTYSLGVGNDRITLNNNLELDLSCPMIKYIETCIEEEVSEFLSTDIAEFVCEIKEENLDDEFEKLMKDEFVK
ncbi:uncharacterized protein [Rutidosis leptorrhynchoides]|uniref:uncharacterized protein n=1 Tax=Rutidosis leptorrhynchoides TaxID=125765 RepID=UPI003A9A22B3